MARIRAPRWAREMLPPSLLAIFAGVLVLLLAGVLVAVVAARQPAAAYPAGSPEATVAAYLRLLQSGQLDEAYALTDFAPGAAPFAAPMTRERFHALFDSWSQTPHQVLLLRASVIGDVASVTVEITTLHPDLFGGSEQRVQQTITLIRQDGAWRVTGPEWLAS